MANLLYVEEFADIIRTVAGGSVMPQDPPVLAGYTLAIGGASTPSPAFNAATRFVRLHADTICSVRVNYASPVAVATDGRLAANQTEFRGVTPGLKLAVITNV
jgi:hypothetical protein